MRFLDNIRDVSLASRAVEEAMVWKGSTGEERVELYLDDVAWQCCGVESTPAAVPVAVIRHAEVKKEQLKRTQC